MISKEILESFAWNEFSLIKTVTNPTTLHHSKLMMTVDWKPDK